MVCRTSINPPIGRHVDPGTRNLSPIIFPYKSIQLHHSQDLNSACAVPVQKIRRFKLALLLVVRSVAFSPPLPFHSPCTHIGVLVPFFFFLSRYHISIQPTSTTISTATTTTITTTTAMTATTILPFLPPPPPSPSLHFHPYFHSIPSSPRFESSMRSPVRKKDALKRFLLAMGTPSPTPYRVYRVPHITNAVFLLSYHPPHPLYPLVHEVSSSSCFFSPANPLIPSSWFPPVCSVLCLTCQTGYT